MTVLDDALKYVLHAGGEIRDPNGGASTRIRDALGAPMGEWSRVMAALVAQGLIRRDSRGPLTFKVELTPKGVEAAKGAPIGNGKVQEPAVQRRDRLGVDGERKAPAVRRKAKKGRRPQRRAAGGKRPAGRRTVRQGHRRVDAAPHDVSGRAGVQEELAERPKHIAILDLRPIPEENRADLLVAIEALIAIYKVGA